MKELDDLIKHIGELVSQPVMEGGTTEATYHAYIKALNTPPECLPKAPGGKKWVRVEYRSWGDAKPNDYLVYKHNGEFTCAAYYAHEYSRGLAQALGHGWRFVDDPDYDSDTWEKIADDADALTGRTVTMPNGIGDRIRKLAAKETK